MEISRRNAVGLGGALSLTAALQGTGIAAPAKRGKIRTIPFEEACLPRELLPAWAETGGTYTPEWIAKLTDFGSQRIEAMDRHGVEMMVLSLTTPGPQAQRDRAKSEDMARRGNDALAKAVALHPTRYVGLGALSMHDPQTACREFERAVKTLGMRGVLLNNFQLAGDDRDGAIFYEGREFDPFWELAQTLDVPVYIHPGPSYGGNMDIKGWDQRYRKFPWLSAAAWFWQVDTGSHALRIITSGVFDRFPKAQLVLGHNGEHIVYDLWRMDNRLKNQPLGYPAKKLVREYFRTNVSVATSGEFSDFALRHVIQEIGVDRVLFAIDTPYEDIKAGADWFDKAAISDAERVAIARGNAIKLLKLPLKVA